MRPVRLTMQAFGPYPDREVVDFREAVEARLFGIYGQTGSGKSTIFSAMTFALFGKPAKEDQDPQSLRSGHANANVKTEVEFIFDIGERRFVILRRPEQKRPKQRGEGETQTQHEAFLFEATGWAVDEITETQRGRIIAEKKVSVVDAAVKDMLGYGPEQFCQIVLLPQGQFEKFLAAKTKDRLEILRELFDVSLYRSLAAQLKKDAEAVVADVQRKREVCVERLAAKNFESTDALADGIVDAKALHAQLLEDEKIAYESFTTAQTALRKGEKIEAQFNDATTAKDNLAKIHAEKDKMASFAERVARARRASTLLHAEKSVVEKADEVHDAEEALQQAQAAVADTKERADSAVEALRVETDRAGEAEDLSRQVEELGRHEQALARAAGTTQEAEKAQAAEIDANKKLNATRRRLTSLEEKGREKGDALKVARSAEKNRQSLQKHIAVLKSSLTAATTFEGVQAEVAKAKTEVETQVAAYKTKTLVADDAQEALEEAEQSLSEMQALHLAKKLLPGAPCPVCGSTEHPTPAPGEIENVGRDQAFRETKDAWEKADSAARGAGQEMAATQSALKERQRRLDQIARPEGSATVIQGEVDAEKQKLNALGSPTDFDEAEEDIERLRGEYKTAIDERTARQEALFVEQRSAATAKARLEEMLSSVPERLRDKQALSLAKTSGLQELAARRTARESAEATATVTREAALVAKQKQQGADAALSTCRQRHNKAVGEWREHLTRANLSEEEFRALKPAIPTIDEDQERVEVYRREVGQAMEKAETTAEAIREQVRPDLDEIKAKLDAADDKRTDTINQRAGAAHRLEDLKNLQSDLAKTIRALDEAETTSGPLRNLAALTNGNNPQNLDIETFAIGAMFDQVLEAANVRLQPMTFQRYELERDQEGAGRGRRGLGIRVFDSHTGKQRPTTTLSGGEAFIAALALALGLADVVESISGKIRLDTIFIDEGFGSLDTENGSGTLDQVLQALRSLVSKNRAVGIISHVDLVQEAIPNGFYVSKSRNGSKVETKPAG